MKIRISPYHGVMAAVAALALAPGAQAGQAAADASGFNLALDVTGRLVLAETQGPVDDDIVDGSLVALRVTPSVSLKRGDTVLTVSNATTRAEYFAETRSDRWQNNARVTADFGLGTATRLQLMGERSDNILTAESSLVDEWEFGAEVQHVLDGANRVALGARWRERRYDDAGRSSGQGPRVEAEYRRRFGPNHYAYLRGRYEEISSANDRRDVQRRFISASYQRPIAKDVRVRPGLAWYRQEFSGRTLAGGGFRRDTVWSPEIDLSYSPGPWRFSLGGRYIARHSTDPDFDRSGYRIAMEISHVF